MKTLIPIPFASDLYELVFEGRTIHRLTRFTSENSEGKNLRFADAPPDLQIKIISIVANYEQD